MGKSFCVCKNAEPSLAWGHFVDLHIVYLSTQYSFIGCVGLWKLCVFYIVCKALHVMSELGFCFEWCMHACYEWTWFFEWCMHGWWPNSIGNMYRLNYMHACSLCAKFYCVSVNTIGCVGRWSCVIIVCILHCMYPVWTTCMHVHYVHVFFTMCRDVGKDASNQKQPYNGGIIGGGRREWILLVCGEGRDLLSEIVH